MAEDRGIEEYVNVVVFATIYGILAILVIGHIFVRWNSRRKSLTAWKPHVPGDSSFQNKSVRQQLLEDFNHIRNLKSDPRLVLHSEQMGTTSDGQQYYANVTPRMKAFDSAADFVSNHMSVLQSSPSQATLTLPQFLNQLQQKGILSNTKDSNIEELVDALSTGYKNARYNLGVFGADDLNHFTQLLLQLEQILSGHCSTSVKRRYSSKATTSSTSGGTASHPHDKRYSQEPLLFQAEHQASLNDTESSESGLGGGGGAEDPSTTEEKDVLKSLSHSSHGGSRLLRKPDLRTTNRPVSLEIPLIDSQASTPLGSSSSPFFSRKPVLDNTSTL